MKYSRTKLKRAQPWIIIGVLLFIAVFLLMQRPSGPTDGRLDTFAKCLKDKGATFYGAFWCPHCQNEKALFGSSAELLPYTECSMPDGQSQTQVCIDKKISSYPTWEFADGSRETGEVTLQKLAEKTGCTLPQ